MVSSLAVSVGFGLTLEVGESVLCIAYFVLAIVPWGCANGVAKLGAVGDYGGGVFWVIVIIIESSLWMLNSLLAG